MKQRLDVVMAEKGMVASRSQAESFVRLGQVTVNGQVATKSGQMVSDADAIKLTATEQYVSRAALKLKSAAEAFKLDFTGKTVLDVGSSTGGFTQYALQHGARKVIAVDVGTDQLHPSLRSDERIELHEKTDIRDVVLEQNGERRMTNEDGDLHSTFVILRSRPDIVMSDVSFISLREILPHVATLVGKDTDIVAMVKPQFEVYAEHGRSTHPSTSSGFRTKVLSKGVIKNDKMRRDILKDFETWAQKSFRILSKADSAVPGGKGNVERFYLLRKLAGPGST